MTARPAPVIALGALLRLSEVRYRLIGLSARCPAEFEEEIDDLRGLVDDRDSSRPACPRRAPPASRRSAAPAPDGGPMTALTVPERGLPIALRSTPPTAEHAAIAKRLAHLQAKRSDPTDLRDCAGRWASISDATLWDWLAEWDRSEQATTGKTLDERRKLGTRPWTKVGIERRCLAVHDRQGKAIAALWRVRLGVETVRASPERQGDAVIRRQFAELVERHRRVLAVLDLAGIDRDEAEMGSLVWLTPPAPSLFDSIEMAA